MSSSSVIALRHAYVVVKRVNARAVMMRGCGLLRRTLQLHPHRRHRRVVVSGHQQHQQQRSARGVGEMQPTRGAGDPPSVQVSAAVPAFIAARFCAPAEGRVGAGAVYTSADGRYLAVVYNDSDSSSKRRRPLESRRRFRS